MRNVLNIYVTHREHKFIRTFLQDVLRSQCLTRKKTDENLNNKVAIVLLISNK